MLRYALLIALPTPTPALLAPCTTPGAALPSLHTAVSPRAATPRLNLTLGVLLNAHDALPAPGERCTHSILAAGAHRPTPNPLRPPGVHALPPAAVRLTLDVLRPRGELLLRPPPFPPPLDVDSTAADGPINITRRNTTLWDAGPTSRQAERGVGSPIGANGTGKTAMAPSPQLLLAAPTPSPRGRVAIGARPSHAPRVRARPRAAS